MASISLGTALLVGGLASAGGSVASGLLGSNAATTAAGQEVNQENQALDFQKQMFATQQANQAPYLAAGTTSLGQLMTALGNGTFGSGSLGAAPQFTGTFTAPTLAQAQQTPGYQFTAQQGSKGILEGSGAAGGAISGGTLKALDSYNTGLADSTYNDVFNRALQTYNTGLQGYQAQLQGYQTAANAQQQEFSQMFAPAQLGENATANINQTGTQASTNVGNLMSSIGQSQAAGTVGSSNALTTSSCSISRQSVFVNSGPSSSCLNSQTMACLPSSTNICLTDAGLL